MTAPDDEAQLRHEAAETAEALSAAAFASRSHVSANDASTEPEVSFAAGAEAIDGRVLIRVYATKDPGPLKVFAPVLAVELDELHALEPLGTLMIAYRAIAAPATSAPAEEV